MTSVFSSAKSKEEYLHNIISIVSDDDDEMEDDVETHQNRWQNLHSVGYCRSKVSSLHSIIHIGAWISFSQVE
jgi:hypothetical protein